jgi:hypothetical protein
VSAALDLLPQRTVVRRKHEEETLQKAVMAYLRLAVPDGVAWHTPNGGQRHAKAAARLKGAGVLAGFPDVALLWRSKLYLIELKAPHGVASSAQRRLWPALIAAGAEVMLCRSLAHVEASLREAGVRLGASVAG